MKYYTAEAPLKLKEYGRTIQNMVEYAKTLTNRNERNALIRDTVRMMALLNPNLKENPDYKQKLWDDLFFLANFDLDVDSEYPMPLPENAHARPKKRMDYYGGNSRFRQYGRTIELMVEKAILIQDMNERKALVTIICNMMKVNIKGIDRDGPVEETVLQHLNVLSNGKLRYSIDEINFSKVMPVALTGNVATFSRAAQKSTKVYAKPSGGYPAQNKNFGFKKKFKK
jgi:Domain of unknown function (DUF4290)